MIENHTISKMKCTAELGTDFWNDSCDLGELEDALAHGAVGATSNPVIVCAVARNNLDRYGPVIDRIARENPAYSEIEISWELISVMAKEAAELLKPVFDRSNGRKGRLSVQVNPVYYRNTEAMVSHGRRLSECAPNLAIKLPVTRAGIAAVRELTSEGASVTATVSFSVSQAISSAEAIEEGLDEAERKGVDIGGISPSVVIMVGRLDDHLKRVMKSEGVSVDPGVLEWAGIAVFKKLYSLFLQRGYRSKLLAAAYRNHMQWSEMIGGKVILTMPYRNWNQFNSSEIETAPRMDQPVSSCIIDTLSAHFADFIKAYDENGLSPEEFEYFGPSVHTLHQFINGYYELLELVRSRILR